MRINMFIFALILVLNIAESEAQRVISLPKDTVNVSWDRVQVDKNGAEEDSVYYRIFALQASPDTKILFIKDTADTFYVMETRSWKEGYYVFGIMAIDKAGNESEITWCNDYKRNTWGAWKLGIDLSAPQRINYLKYHNAVK